MESREVRIGNLFDNNGNVNTVTPGVIEALFESDKRSWIQPIPLTEEWLLKFGFEIYEFDHKENQYRFKERLLVIRKGVFCDYGTNVELKYVHQLQNLYFALTGEELEYGK